MKKFLLIIVFLTGINSYSQEHFAGMLTSQNSGILAGAALNPAEFNNISKKIEINVFSASINISNNKIVFSDLLSSTNLENKLFEGNKPVTLLFNSEVYGPSIAIKKGKWAFAITTKATGVLNFVNIDSEIGAAISDAQIPGLFDTTTINNNKNQRINGTTWGELGVSIARSLVDNNFHKLNIGGTFKLLFPGSYANLGLSNFQGSIANEGGQFFMNNTNANLNFTYSGGLANSFSDFNEYFNSVLGGLNGFSGDVGINYQWKDKVEVENQKKQQKYYTNNYKLNFGLSLRNIGAMSFKSENNFATNYNLSIQPTSENPNGLNLDVFQNANGIKEIETVLINQGYLNKTEAEKKEFDVKLPTTITAYIDLKLFSKLYVSGFLQQRISENESNDQISAQNVITVTPRLNLGVFEIFSPFTNSEISGFHVGFGFRLAGFYLGSNSIITGIINNNQQADAYVGYKIGLL
jgi:hypothetical protein